MEVLWVAIFGGALAWLQAQSASEQPVGVEVEAPVEEEWRRWEQELYDWRER